MSVIGHSPLAGASGAAGGADPLYVDDVFSTFLYDGTGSANSINNGIDLSGKGGAVWIKQRDESRNHSLYDTERGVLRQLVPNSTNAQGGASGNDLDAFNSNGFSLGTDTFSIVNKSGGEYVSWSFRKARQFFDVLTYNGTGSVQNISHALGSVPGMIMIHCMDGSHDWEVYHRATGATKSLHLNKTDAQATDSTVWNNTTPTSSVFTVGTSSNVNQNGHEYVAYVFAHDEQAYGADSDKAIIKCGSYTGNGSTDGPEVNLGFEPQFLIQKRVNNADSWLMFDNMRGFPTNEVLYANGIDAEAGFGSTVIRHTSTGFKLTTVNSNFNSNGETYIYVAIRRSHKPPTAGTEVFAVNTRNGNQTAGTLSTAGFPVDLAIITPRNVAHWTSVFDRLRGRLKFLATQVTNAENTYNNTLTGFDNNTAIEIGTDSTNLGVNRNSQTYVDHLFKRAPGFFDVVTYTGTGSARTVSHNLDVAPELMIVKARDRSESWPVYISSVGATGALYLNSSGDVDTGAYYWNDTAPAAQQFTVGTLNAVNRNTTTYIAYLFATLNGISKIGSYSGTGSNVNVDCDFTAGARFVLIKRTDSSGDWYYWDTARGIVSGNDPYLRFSSTDAEVTNTDYVDPLNAGFTVTSSAPAALNASGGTYFFLAIA